MVDAEPKAICVQLLPIAELHPCIASPDYSDVQSPPTEQLQNKAPCLLSLFGAFLTAFLGRIDLI